MDRMKDLRRSLCEGQFIDKGTLEEHFLFWFGLLDDKPGNLCSINWIETKKPIRILRYAILSCDTRFSYTKMENNPVCLYI